MRFLDALGDVPKELVGVYDVVQLRLFQVVVKDGDPGLLLRNVVSMLSARAFPFSFLFLLSFFLILFSRCRIDEDVDSSRIFLIVAAVAFLSYLQDTKNFIPAR